MKAESLQDNFQKDLDEYEHWIDMEWGVNRYEDDDIAPIISLRDDIHTLVLSSEEDIQDENIKRLKRLDRKWQSFIYENRDPEFRFNFSNFDKDKSQWWWWIDRLDELSDKQKSTL